MKAILIISFGTTHHDTLEKTIVPFECEVSERFIGFEVRRAFTSGMIINKLKTRDGIHTDTVSEAIERLLCDGCTELICQPTHIINGAEYDKLCSDISKYSDKLNIKTGTPLLTSSGDYIRTAKLLGKVYGREKTYILMGHGSTHHANSAYPAMDYCLRTIGYSNIHMASVEGYPTLSDALSNIKSVDGTINRETKSVTVAPFMFVAGDHAKNDLAGDSEASWKSVLEEKGYTVSCDMMPLGERSEIRKIYIDHIMDAINL